MRIIAIVIGFWALSTAALAASDTILITATRLTSSSEEVASSFTVIDQEELQRKKPRTVDEVLATAPSVVVQRNGGPGQPSSVLIRGAKSEHTLVLIDGIVVNDALTPARSFDFSHLSTDNIQRIEIIRGPQSVLYGSDAIGGVIHIITKKGGGKSAGFAKIETGAYDTQNAAAGIHGTAFDFLAFSVENSFEKSEGFSAAAEQFGNKEKDAYRRYTIAPSLDMKLGTNGKLEWNSRYIQAKADTDAFGGAGGDSIGTFARTVQLHSRLQYQQFLAKDRWESLAALAYSQNNRTDNTLGDTFFRSNRKKADWQNNISLSNDQTLTAGIEASQEEGRATSIPQKKDTENFGLFYQHKLGREDWFGTAGARVDKHSIYGYSVTHRLAPGYHAQSLRTKFKASYGTGFKAPSLYQLHSNFGSTALNPEKSRSHDLGAEFYATTNTSLEIVYFNNQFREMIDFDSITNRYRNITQAESYGWEGIARIMPLDSVDLALNYTWLRARDRSTGAYLNRRPRNSWSARSTWRFNASSIGAEAIFVGKRNDGNRQLPEYALVNMNTNYRFLQIWTLSMRLQNALNRKYEEIAGYGTAARSFYLGIQADL